MDELKVLISEEEADVIAITEVKPKKSLFPVLESDLFIEGYTVVSNIPGVSRSSGRGMILYIKEEFTVITKDLNTEFQEVISLDIVLPSGEVISLVLIYRSPNSTMTNNLALTKTINTLAASPNSKFIMVGDFNLPRIDWSNLQVPDSSYEDIFLNTIMDNYLHQHVTEFTRIRSDQVKSTLDLVFTQNEEMIKELSLLNPLGKSDHLVLKMILNESVCCTVPEPRYKSLLHKGDYNGIRGEIEEIDWDTLFLEKSVDQSWQLFKDILLSLQDKYIPTVRIKEGSKPKPKWMDKEVTLAIKNKASAWKKYKWCRTASNFLRYKKARNGAKQLITRSRMQFEHKIASEAKSKPKSFWNYVGRQTKQTSEIQKIRNKEGILSQSNLETASFLNTYFASVFTDDANIINLDDSEFKPPALLNNCIIEETQILEALMDLKVDKSAGPDGILPRVLSESKCLITKPLKLLFDKSLNTGKVPRDWKDATVVPIYKKGKRDLAENYRPVSLTCVVSKIMEKFIKQAIMDHLLSQGLLSDKQYGFVPGRSCTLQLLVCVEKWSLELDSGKPVDIVYTDFSKAFDKVSHQKLIWKLKRLGVNDKILHWIIDFLQDRRQRVRISDSVSGWEVVRSGVPQGSVLGPTLFLAYINDLPEAVQLDTLKLFADDAKLDSTITAADDSLVLQENLNLLAEWSEKWSLEINPSKCKILHLTGIRPTINYSYYLQGSEGQRQLESVDHEKDLGVVIDGKLNFHAHVKKAVLTANKVTGIIRRNFKYMGEETFLTLYKSLVRPHIEYSSTVWNPTMICDQKLIEGVQRRATKLIPSISGLSYPQRLKKLGLPSLQYRRLRADMLQVYKIIHGFDRVTIETFFELSGSDRTRGHRYKINKQRSKTNIRKYSFSNRVIDTWNSLPDTVVESENINQFKSKLNTHWKGHPIKFSPSFYH